MQIRSYPRVFFCVRVLHWDSHSGCSGCQDVGEFPRDEIGSGLVC